MTIRRPPDAAWSGCLTCRSACCASTTAGPSPTARARSGACSPLTAGLEAAEVGGRGGCDLAAGGNPDIGARGHLTDEAIEERQPVRAPDHLRMHRDDAAAAQLDDPVQLPRPDLVHRRG